MVVKKDIFNIKIRINKMSEIKKNKQKRVGFRH